MGSMWSPARWRLPDDSSTPRESDLYRDPGGQLYCKAWLANRFVVGVLGAVMPLALILGEWAIFPDSGASFPRSSLSSYFFSGLTGIFVGTLYATGVFLITYMAFHWNWDNLVSTLAGIAALSVALFPTGPEAGGSATPIQLKLGVHHVQMIHQVSAFTFITFLAVMSLRFARSEGQRGNRGHRIVHVVMTCLMAGSAAAALIAGYAFGVKSWGPMSGLLLVELICTYAFAFSWLLKGFEISHTLVMKGFYGEQAKLRLRLRLSEQVGPQRQPPTSEALPGTGQAS